MPIYACHQTEEYFPEPGAFRPERFLESGADQIVPYTYRPFGGAWVIRDDHPHINPFFPNKNIDFFMN